MESIDPSPVNLLDVQGPNTSKLVEYMEWMWREVNRGNGQKPNLILVPLSWFERGPIGRVTHHWRGRRFVITHCPPIRADILRQMGLDPVESRGAPL